MTPRRAVFTIPPGKPFVDALAAGVLAGALGIDAEDPLALARATILLPTRRACRALVEAFLRQGGGRAMLLPRVMALGDIDEDELELGAGESLGAAAHVPPAIPELRRQLLLAASVMRWAAELRQEPVPADQAARLARELARLLDRVQTEQLSFDRLADLVPEDYAAHWQLTLDFLKILTRDWPEILAAEGCIDPAQRRNELLAAQAKAWEADPPTDPVIAAGTTGSIPATAALLERIVRLPRGALVLPGLDLRLDEESWQALDETHPQFAMARLLERLEVPREAVREWDAGEVESASPARAALVSEALRPAETTDAWRSRASRARGSARGALEGVVRIDCPSPREEAGAIALLMREALETPGKRAALVTPDRGLARRVAAELRRWGIDVDDSAGTPLCDTPPGSYLRLTAALVAEGWAPLPLLSALKHPLAAGGARPASFRATVRALERAVLRGPRPGEGLAGLRAALRASGALDARRRKRLEAWLERLHEAARPFTDQMTRDRAELAELVRAHVTFAEALAASAADEGHERLWAGDAGEAAAAFVAKLLQAAAGFPSLPGVSYPGLLEAVMAGRVVRPRYGRHPRLFIWGPLEARLQHVDLMILGAFNEGTWPPESRADPWMSRPMRAEFGLPLPERRIGLSAHDFAQAFSAPEVALTRATRVEGSPTVESRWLLRLENLLPEGGKIPRGERYLHWHAQLDKPARLHPLEPPAPKPPVSARPRKIRVTEVETLIRDPYAVYARRVLGLEPLDPIDADPGAAERGSFIHLALERFVQEFPGDLPEDAVERLLALGREAFGDALARPGVRAFWWPRFERVAHWFIGYERKRRAEGVTPLEIEVRGELELSGPAGPVALVAKADRIDRLPDSGLAILDYKTGAVPSGPQVTSGLAPQLPLEAAIAAAGGFDGVPSETVAELAYVRLTGRGAGGEVRVLADDPTQMAAEALAGLERLMAAFDRPATPYRSRPRPMFERRFGEYDHLARVKEWSSGLGEGE
ncbi:MAG: double-strand break repair protein AddB [Alphaproteobacteria bacterium]